MSSTLVCKLGNIDEAAFDNIWSSNMRLGLRHNQRGCTHNFSLEFNNIGTLARASKSFNATKKLRHKVERVLYLVRSHVWGAEPF